MFLFGLIFGIVIGMNIHKTKTLFNTLELKTKGLGDDLRKSIRFFMWKRECRKNDI